MGWDATLDGAVYEQEGRGLVKHSLTTGAESVLYPYRSGQLHSRIHRFGFSRSGTLRAGSGHHFLVIQSANGPAIDVQVLKNSDGSPLDPTLQARYGVVRIR